MITSTVEGVKTEGGVSGFFSGLGKGLVGTVTKPVAGALDFASETAQTVRDMASLSNRYLFRLFFLLWKRAYLDELHIHCLVHGPFPTTGCQKWCPR